MPLHDQRLIAAFDRSAGAYDRLVAANPGYHHHLRRAAARLRLPHGGAGLHVLDAGCGTGASTAALLTTAPHARITAVDASAGMLDQARAKPWPRHPRFVHTRVEDLAAAGVTGPFDAIFAGYLLRNVTDPDTVLASFHRLLRPGGVLGVHEYTLTGAWAHRARWSAVCWAVVIPASALARGDRALHRHLWRSVLRFDTASALRDRLVAAGFPRVRIAPAGGWQRGVAHTFVAHRPTGSTP